MPYSALNLFIKRRFKEITKSYRSGRALASGDCTIFSAKPQQMNEGKDLDDLALRAQHDPQQALRARCAN
jgi:hypothetical protein